MTFLNPQPKPNTSRVSPLNNFLFKFEIVTISINAK